MESLYAGVPLSYPDQQIRLLRLLPGSSEDDIVCGLSVVNLEQQGPPEYVAISYVWGPPHPTVVIKVENFDFRVRLNCFYALWQMKQHGHTSGLCIDSICINQANDHEKSIQVTRMATIYRSAQFVAASLGQGDMLATLHDAIAVSSRSYTTYLIADAMNYLSRNPYYSRIWIKQEFILAQDLKVFCGLDVVAWREIASLVERVYNKIGPAEKDGLGCLFLERSIRFPPTGDSSKSVQVAWRPKHDATPLHRGSPPLYDMAGEFVQVPISTQQKRGSELLNLLQRYGDAKCSDPRDRIYALRSLLPDSDTALTYMTVDYSKTMLEFTRELIIFIIAMHSRHDMRDFLRIIPRYFSCYIEKNEAHEFLNARSSMTPLIADDETSRNTKCMAMVTATRFFYLMEEELDDPFCKGYVKDIQPEIDRLSGLASLTPSSAKEIEESKTLRAACAVLGQNAKRAKFVRFYETHRKTTESISQGT
jgi:hypothetical protein